MSLLQLSSLSSAEARTAGDDHAVSAISAVVITTVVPSVVIGSASAASSAATSTVSAVVVSRRIDHDRIAVVSSISARVNPVGILVSPRVNPVGVSASAATISPRIDNYRIATSAVSSITSAPRSPSAERIERKIVTTDEADHCKGSENY